MSGETQGQPFLRRWWMNAGLAVLCGSFALFADQPSSRKSSVPTPISVCELFLNLTSYRHKLVAVRGIYWYGLRGPCQESFVTANHRWPKALNLTATQDSNATGLALPFQTDHASWDELDRAIRRQAAAGRRAEIWVTVVGFVEAPERYVRTDGQVVGGFGHLGVFPAQLIVKHVADVVIQLRPTYNYGDRHR